MIVQHGEMAALPDHAPALSLGCLIAFAALAAFAVLADFAGEWAVHASQAGVYAVAAAWCAASAGRPVRFGRHWLLAPFAAIVLVGALQLIAGWTVSPLHTTRELLYWGSLAALFAVGVRLLASQRVRERLLRWLSWFSGALAIVVILQALGGGGLAFWLFETGYDDQVLGPFVNRDHYAAFAVLVLPIVVHRFFSDRSSQLADAIIAGLLYSSVIVSASRAGFLIATAELAVLLAPNLLRRQSARAAAVRILLALAVLAILVGADSLRHRLRADNPLEFRQKLLGSTIEMIQERPWTGFGLGTWPLIYPQYAEFDPGLFVNHAHNDWAEWWADGGIPLLLPMLLLAGGGAALAFRQPYGIGVPAIFLHSMADYPLRKYGLAATAVLLLASMTAARLHQAGSRSASRSTLPLRPGSRPRPRTG